MDHSSAEPRARPNHFLLPDQDAPEARLPCLVQAVQPQAMAAENAAGVFTRGVIDQSEKNLAVMRQAYNLGELRLIDVLNEQRRLLDVEFNYIDTQADLYRTYAELEHATGGSLQ